MKPIKTIRAEVSSHEYDDLLSRIYCRPVERLQPYRDRIEHVLDGYIAAFHRSENAEDTKNAEGVERAKNAEGMEVSKTAEDTEVAIFSAPGRTEIGGNHTDHQRGRVLTGSVDLDALACAACSGTDEVRIFSEGYGLTSIDITDLAQRKDEENTTKALIRGTLAGVASRGYRVGGFDAFVTSDVPGGSGLSSSACFEVLIGTIINRLFCNDAIEPAEIAKIGQYAENVYFGKPSGLLDQMGCAIGGIVAIDFRDSGAPRYRSVDFDFAKAGHALCIIDTGADHADLTGDYAAVPAEMKKVAAFFGKEVLCEIDEKEFYDNTLALRKDAGDRAVMRAIHYYADCRRVDQQVEALETGDFQGFLELVNRSGDSSWMYLQNVDTYRDPGNQPVAAALAMARHYLKGRGAVRVHGGGFAGTIQAFIPLDMAEEFRRDMDSVLGGGACRITYIRPVGGCTLID